LPVNGPEAAASAGKTGRTDRQPALKVRFHGALGTVTGSVHFLHHVPSDTWLAIDCGLLQESTNLKGNTPAELPVKPAKVAHLFLTHAHLDHIGMLPSWIDAGFDGKIWCTRPTAELTIIALEEIVRRSSVPLNHAADHYADFVRKRLVCPDDRHSFRFGAAHEVLPELDVSLFPTAHVVGSVAFRFRGVSKYYSHSEIGFLGDIGPIEDDAHGGLTPARALPAMLPRTVVCESTYGDRPDATELPRDFASRQEALAAALRATLAKGERATALIPVFTMQRTTDVLLDVMALLRAHGVALGLSAGDEVEVAIPSEGAQKYAKVLLAAYERVLSTGERPWYNPRNRLLGAPAETPADVARQFALLRRMLAPDEEVSLETTEAGVRLRLTWGGHPRSQARLKIILCSSGSTTFGQAHQLIYRHLENPAASLILVGFVPEESIGGQLKRLLEGADTPELLGIPVPGRDEMRETWPVDRIALAVHNLSAWYSGHASKGSLVRLLRGRRQPGRSATPLSVMLVHGRPPARMAMVRALKDGAEDEAWAHRLRHVHFPTQLSPEYDAGRHLFVARGMDALRTRSIVRWPDSQGRNPATYVYGRLRRLLHDRIGLLTPDLRCPGQLVAFGRNDREWCRHQVIIKPVVGEAEAAEIVVESDVGMCEGDESFRQRLFVWNEVMAATRNTVDRRPLYCGDHLTMEALQQLMQQRNKPFVLYASGPSDRRAAANLSMFLAGAELEVVVLAPEYLPVARALGFQVGAWIACAVMPGLEPIPFTSDDYFGIAPVLVAAMNEAIPAEPFSLEVMNYRARPA
jgi:metallo-beta-lactamase family protein